MRTWLHLFHVCCFLCGVAIGRCGRVARLKPSAQLPARGLLASGRPAALQPPRKSGLLPRSSSLSQHEGLARGRRAGEVQLAASIPMAEWKDAKGKLSVHGASRQQIPVNLDLWRSRAASSLAPQSPGTRARDPARVPLGVFIGSLLVTLPLLAGLTAAARGGLGFFERRRPAGAALEPLAGGDLRNSSSTAPMPSPAARSPLSAAGPSRLCGGALSAQSDGLLRSPLVGVSALGGESTTVSASSSGLVQDGERANALEEQLMSLDLPQPLRPVLGSQAWANFSATLAQMGVIGILSGLGTFLEQGGPAEFYAQKYPSFSGIILSLGLDNVYSSPFFIALLVWLGASLLACTATTQLPLAKRAQRMKLKTDKAAKRAGTFSVKIRCRPDSTDKEPAQAEPTEATGNSGANVSSGQCALRAADQLCSLKAALEQRGFAVRTDHEPSPTQLVATRGLVGKFAPMAVHLALVLCLLGGGVGILCGSSSEAIISDGGTADLGRALDEGRRAKGPFYAIFNPFKSLLDTTTIRVDDFRIDYRENGAIEQFYSKLSIEDSKTGEKFLSDEIYVNKPLRYGGSTLYQSDWGIDRLQIFLNGRPYVINLKSLPAEGNERSWGGFVPLSLLEGRAPTANGASTETDAGIVLIAENMRNVQVYGSDKKLAGILRSPRSKIDKRMEGMPVQFGETIQVDGSELRLDRILGYTGLLVKSDPGVPLVYLGFALLMPATLFSVLPYVQVWAARSKDDPDEIILSGRANRNQPAFEEEMQATVLSTAS